jgi:hypothetical protein
VNAAVEELAVGTLVADVADVAAGAVSNFVAVATVVAAVAAAERILGRADDDDDVVVVVVAAADTGGRSHEKNV